jgi:hypothetical protein
MLYFPINTYIKYVIFISSSKKMERKKQIKINPYNNKNV